MTAPREALTATGLVKSLGGRTVVDGVNLTLASNTITALLGPSGAGKSTVLRLLAGLEPVDQGEVRIGERVLSRPGHTVPPEKRNTGLIFQDFALFPHLTASENVSFGLAHLSKTDRGREALAWLERLGLAHRAGAYPHQLSGGEQQRVAIARALAPGPQALLMDEPFSGLDPALRDEVADITVSAIREAGVPALLVSHDASAAMARADQLAIMRGGKILQSGTADNLYDTPNSLAVARALGPLVIFGEDTLPESLWHGALNPGHVLAVREAAFRIDPTSPCEASVVDVARIAEDVRVTFRVGEHDFAARLPHYQRPREGDVVCLSLHPDGTFVFPATATDSER
ncbi:MAG: ABC transporter ATP-binding protein [Pseudomonadota bacterium]